MNPESGPEDVLKQTLEAIKQIEPDRSGSSPMQAMLQYLKGLGPVLPLAISQGFVLTVAKIPTLPAEEVRNFVTILSGSNIILEKVLAHAIHQTVRKLKRSSHSKETIQKRADLLRLLNSRGHAVTAHELEQESNILEVFPWIWIDMMIDLKFDRAVEQISMELKKNSKISFDSLMSRLPHYWRKRGSELHAALRSWANAVSVNQAEQIRNWAAANKIEFERTEHPKGWLPPSINDQEAFMNSYTPIIAVPG